MHDLVIRGATVVDGLGHDPIQADVAVQNGRIAVGAWADLLLFDPAEVGISKTRRVADLPGGDPRTIRDPLGVHGVFVNGARVFDGKDYARLAKGPGQVLERFLPARRPRRQSAAQSDLPGKCRSARGLSPA